MDLTKLNKACVPARKPVVKLQDLSLNHPHQILEAKIVRTKFGESVLLELAEKVVFLPKRATEGFRPVVNQFNTGAYSVVYRGQQAVPGVQNPLNNFEIVDNSSRN